jgi:hypothetical protein
MRSQTCCFYAQNLPTVVTLPCAGLALTLFLLFFSPGKLLGELQLSNVDQSITCRDGTFFDKNTEVPSAYAKGVLITKVTWAAYLVCYAILVRTLQQSVGHPLPYLL